ncbi:CAP domain-containing protein [Paenibacillus agri]|uniref:Serine protease n=1 Tax=Paenibacillus agri TaxID=2744309 RepID=A0A850ETL5_9BACL|nr:CAP domain-containing protein [Paenibacillus agri]NUU63180.1 serine protease [Paenibacillus agri]
MKSRTLRAMIGGSVAAVMALSITLPLTANAASSVQVTTTTSTISYDELLKYLSNLNIKGFPFNFDNVTGVSKPQTTPAPVATPAPAKPVVTPKPVKPVATPAPTAPPKATPVPAKPVPTQAPAAGQAGTYTQQIVTLVNKERAAAGLPPVSALDSLNKVAAAKATDMRSNNYFDHNSPTYGSPFDMMKSFGITYRAAGENIAMGQRSPEEVMTAWMNSPGHRANILNKDFNYIGVGFDNNYWVQEFIGK